MEGTGKIQLTGSLGDVMKESARRGHHLHPCPSGTHWESPREFYDEM